MDTLSQNESPKTNWKDEWTGQLLYMWILRLWTDKITNTVFLREFEWPIQLSQQINKEQRNWKCFRDWKFSARIFNYCPEPSPLWFHKLLYVSSHLFVVGFLSFSCRSFKENVHQLQASCNSQNSQLLTAEKDKWTINRGSLRSMHNPTNLKRQGSKLTLANSQNVSAFDNLQMRKISTSKRFQVRVIHVSQNIWKEFASDLTSLLVEKSY